MSKKKIFGYSGGQEIYLFTLTNDCGTEVTVSNYGGIITSIKVADKRGRIGDVVLGYDSFEEYLADDFYIGCLIGRYANRISGGKLFLDSKAFQLTQNESLNHLHGGLRGFGKVVWDARILDSVTDQSIQLTYASREMEEGYPGNLLVQVVYRLSQDNSLKLEYSAASDANTVINLTHHSYFNLSDSDTVLDHHLAVNADRFTPVDLNYIPTGELQSLSGSGLEFSELRPIRDCLEKRSPYLIDGGLDHNYILKQNRGKRPAATLVSNDTGRKMEVLTSEPGLQVYTGNFLDGSIRGKGKEYCKYGGICLEAQAFPDAPNHENFPPTTLRPGEIYRQQTEYRFSLI